MAGRITLLMLMTGLFASAWSSDRDPQAISATASRSRRAKPIPAVRETALQRWHNSATDQTASANPAWAPTNELQATAPASRDIPAGTYLVVNPDGCTERVVIAATRFSPENSAADHFVTQFQGQRQHWVRMTESAPPAIGHEKIVVVLIDGSELAEQPPGRQFGRKRTIPARPSLQRLLTPLMQALNTLRDDSRGPMSADGADSVNR